MTEDLTAIRDGTRGVYERQAPAWDGLRSHALFEKGWLDRFVAALPPGGTVLDVGCATGRPLGLYLMEKGLRVTGVDFAAPMLAIARERFPDCRWIHADMRTMDLGERFDGVLAWDSFFHLTMAEQRDVIGVLSRHVGETGSLLLTIGHLEGETTGRVGDGTVYHASLAPDAYRDLLSAEGFGQVDITLQDAECGGHSVLLAQRR